MNRTLLAVVVCFCVLAALAQAQAPVVSGYFTSTDGKDSRSLGCFDQNTQRWTINRMFDRTISSIAAWTRVGNQTFYYSKNQVFYFNGTQSTAMLGVQGLITGSVAKIAINQGASTMYLCGPMLKVGTRVIQNTTAVNVVVVVDISQRDAGIFPVTYDATNYPVANGVDCNFLIPVDTATVVVADNVFASKALRRWDPVGKTWTNTLNPNRSLNSYVVRFASQPTQETLFAVTNGNLGTDPASDATLSYHVIQKLSGTSWITVKQLPLNYLVSSYVVASSGSVFYMSLSNANSTATDLYYFWSYATSTDTFAKIGTNGRFSSGSGYILPSLLTMYYDTALSNLVVYGAQYFVYGSPTFDTDISQPYAFYGKPLAGLAKLGAAGVDFTSNVYGGGFTTGTVPAFYNAGGAVTCVVSTAADFRVYDTWAPNFAVFDTTANRYTSLLPRGFDLDFTAGNNNFNPSTYTPVIYDYAKWQSSTPCSTNTGNIYEAYVVGQFRIIDNTTVNSIAKVSSCSGTAVTSLGPDSVNVGVMNWNVAYDGFGNPRLDFTSTSPGQIFSVVYLQSAGMLYVGGSFNRAGTSAVRNLARYNTATQTWYDVAGGVTGPVYKLLVDGNKLYVAGIFKYAGHVLVNNIAYFDMSAQTWNSLNNGLDGAVTQLTMFNGALYALGSFSSGSGSSMAGLAVWQNNRWTYVNINAPTVSSNSCPSNAPVKYTVPLCSVSSPLSMFVVNGQLYIVTQTGILYVYNNGQLTQVTDRTVSTFVQAYKGSLAVLTSNSANADNAFDYFDTNLVNTINADSKYFNGQIVLVAAASSSWMNVFLLAAAFVAWIVMLF